MSANGTLVAVCIGPGGIPKAPLDCVQVDADGLRGDRQRHPEHGGEARAVCLLSEEELALLEAEGVPPQAPGGYGENLLIRGLDFTRLRPGMQLAIGADLDPVQIELTDVRSPCITLEALDPRFPDLMLGRSGFVGRIVRPGRLSPGMAVRLVE